MSITDELRKFAWKECPSKFLERVIGIADDIEQAHTMEIGEVADSFKDCIPLRIPLPKDADGKTIHLQDRMSWDNGTFIVHELDLTADGWTTWDELHGYTVRADQCHHVQPDSWERIIRDAQGDGILNQIDGRPSDFDALVERCKRLAGEDA